MSDGPALLVTLGHTAVSNSGMQVLSGAFDGQPALFTYRSAGNLPYNVIFISDAEDSLQANANGSSALVGYNEGRYWGNPGTSGEPGMAGGGVGCCVAGPTTVAVLITNNTLSIYFVDLTTGFWSGGSSAGPSANGPGADINRANIVKESNGNYLVFYSDITANNTWAVEYNPGSDTWGASVQIDGSAVSSEPVTAVIDPNDVAHVVFWTPGGATSGGRQEYYVQYSVAGGPNTPVGLFAIPDDNGGGDVGVASIITTPGVESIIIPYQDIFNPGPSQTYGPAFLEIKPYTSTTPAVIPHTPVSGVNYLLGFVNPTSYSDNTTCTLMWIEVTGTYPTFTLMRICYTLYHGTETGVLTPYTIHDELNFPSPFSEPLLVSLSFAPRLAADGSPNGYFVMFGQFLQGLSSVSGAQYFFVYEPEAASGGIGNSQY